MFKSRILEVVVLIAALVPLVMIPNVAGANAEIRIDGSSTMYPITNNVAKSFKETKKDKIGIKIDISGTGGGFAKFCRQEIDIVNASRPILGKEMRACSKSGVRYVELPVAFDALTVVVNPGNDWSRTMTVDELREIWQPDATNKITRWSQVNPAWPDQKLKLYAAGPGSGPSIISPRRSWASQKPAAAISRHPGKMMSTSCFRAWRATKMRSVSLVLDIIRKIRTRSRRLPSITILARQLRHRPKPSKMEPISLYPVPSSSM